MKRHVSLPWPPKPLWPNRRANWRTKSKAARIYKQAAWALAYRAGEKWPTGPVRLSITFRPPTAAKRDLDNMLAAVKHGIDGIACALGVDDGLFAYTIARGSPINGGAVEVLAESEVGAQVDTDRQD